MLYRPVATGTRKTVEDEDDDEYEHEKAPANADTPNADTPSLAQHVLSPASVRFW